MTHNDSYEYECADARPSACRPAPKEGARPSSLAPSLPLVALLSSRPAETLRVASRRCQPRRPAVRTLSHHIASHHSYSYRRRTVENAWHSGVFSTRPVTSAFALLFRIPMCLSAAQRSERVVCCVSDDARREHCVRRTARIVECPQLQC